MIAKFKFCSFNVFRDMEVVCNYQSRSRDTFTTLGDRVLHFFR